ncbi:GTP pyrophosphokinase [Sunxiuqinia elliptica]|uniref:PpGpp synthetase catalytic domain-containing protein (RelA/SpoT-type nucleotidyltranferase) n=1 Tax=Sunxiuqinia elliptica TaxID=655355 RepID=A0A1I2FY33_9BACT|nr:(p)ppGpp synthetase [Sunxiuqinia elliptica]SFF09717.1 ppGpp synthetase catalytic domain-containing protein (RelA/SpoT-type nucleotidyltranferase) [Sunxiuqinia elliptica]
MEDVELKIKEFKKYYYSNLAFYNSALRFLIELIDSLPKVEHVSGRIKDYSECLSKFNRKYVSKISEENRDYQIIDSLSDFIGIRVVCLYVRDVNLIREELKRYFIEVAITDKTDQLESTDDKFGYKSLHLDLKLNSEYCKKVELIPYANVRFELQIRTIIQDAWSVLDHKIKYKKSIPQSLKRRINRLSALFEIADDEFLRINDEILLEEKRINDRIKQGGTIEKDKALDVFRFLFVVLKYFPNYNFIEFKVDGFVQEILDIKKGFTESELNDGLRNYLHIAEKVEQKEKKELNPYTKIRYCLYLFDRDLFSSILSTYQKNSLLTVG